MKPWKKKDSPADHTAGKKGCGELEGNFVHAHRTEIPLETPDQYGNQTGSYGIRDASLVKKGEAEGCQNTSRQIQKRQRFVGFDLVQLPLQFPGGKKAVCRNGGLSH